jgi:aconitate hydratase
MGVVPLQLEDGVTAEGLGLDGTETYDLDPIDVSQGLPKSRTVKVRATSADGSVTEFACIVRVDTPMEGAFLASGGILPYVLGQLAGE